MNNKEKKKIDNEEQNVEEVVTVQNTEQVSQLGNKVEITPDGDRATLITNGNMTMDAVQSSLVNDLDHFHVNQAKIMADLVVAGGTSTSFTNTFQSSFKLDSRISMMPRQVSEVPQLLKLVRYSNMEYVRAPEETQVYAGIHMIQETKNMFDFGMISLESMVSTTGFHPKFEIPKDELPATSIEFTTPSIFAGIDTYRTVATINIASSILEILLCSIAASRMIIVQPEIQTLNSVFHLNYDVVARVCKSKIINQKGVVYLPFAAIGNRVKWLTEEIFAELDSNPEMYNGALGLVDDAPNTYQANGLRLITYWNVVTDGITSALLMRYMEYLRSNIADMEYMTRLFKFYSYPGALIGTNLKFPDVYTMYQKRSIESLDMIKLLHIVNVEARLYFMERLRTELSGYNLLTFVDPSVRFRDGSMFSGNVEVSSFIQRKVISGKPDDFYHTLVLNYSVDFCRPFISLYKPSGTMEALLIIVGIIGWYMYFPAIAVDNGNYLIALLFRCLEMFIPEQVVEFLNAHKFSNQSFEIDAGTYESYKSGQLVINFLVVNIRRGSKILKSIQTLLQKITSEGSVFRVRADSSMPILKYGPFRTYHYNYKFVPITESITSSLDTYFTSLTVIVSQLIMILKGDSKGLNINRGLDSTANVITFAQSLIRYFLDNKNSLSSVACREVPVLLNMMARSNYFVYSSYTGGLLPTKYIPRPYGIYNRGGVDLDPLSGSFDERPLNVAHQMITLNFDHIFTMFFCIHGAIDFDTISTSSGTFNVIPKIAIDERINEMDVLSRYGELVGDALSFAMSLHGNSQTWFTEEFRKRYGALFKGRDTEKLFQYGLRLANADWNSLFESGFKTIANAINFKLAGFRIKRSSIMDPYDFKVNDTSNGFDLDLNLRSNYTLSVAPIISHLLDLNGPYWEMLSTILFFRRPVYKLSRSNLYNASELQDTDIFVPVIVTVGDATSLNGFLTLSFPATRKTDGRSRNLTIEIKVGGVTYSSFFDFKAKTGKILLIVYSTRYNDTNYRITTDGMMHNQLHEAVSTGDVAVLFLDCQILTRRKFCGTHILKGNFDALDELLLTLGNRLVTVSFEETMVPPISDVIDNAAFQQYQFITDVDSETILKNTIFDSIITYDKKDEGQVIDFSFWRKPSGTSGQDPDSVNRYEYVNFVNTVPVIDDKVTFDFPAHAYDVSDETTQSLFSIDPSSYTY